MRPQTFRSVSSIESTTSPITLILDKSTIVIGNVIVSIHFKLQITKLPMSGDWRPATPSKGLATPAILPEIVVFVMGSMLEGF